MLTEQATPEYTVNQEASVPTAFIQDSCLLSQNYGCFNEVSQLYRRDGIWSYWTTKMFCLSHPNPWKVPFSQSESCWILVKFPLWLKQNVLKNQKNSTVFWPVAALLHFNPHMWDMQIDLLMVACSVMAKIHVPDCSKCMFCFTQKLHRIGKLWIIHVIFGISNLFESWIP